MSEHKPGHWLFVVRTEDRPGAAADIAVVFSGRGIQLESLVGSGDLRHPPGEGQGTICLTFQAFESRQEMVRRVLQRLEVVRSVEGFDYDRDPRLVKAAALRLERWDDSVEAALVEAGVAFHRMDDRAAGTIVSLSGRPPAVDHAIGALAGAGLLSEAACSLLPPAIAGLTDQAREASLA